jgi:hypothetical protein
MGTTESFQIKAIGQSKTPIELSAFVLNSTVRFASDRQLPDRLY